MLFAKVAFRLVTSVAIACLLSLFVCWLSSVPEAFLPVAGAFSVVLAFSDRLS